MIPRCRTVGRSTIAAGLDLSPRRRHTRTRRLSLDKQKRDSSENTTLCHSVIHVDLARHHSKRWRLFDEPRSGRPPTAVTQEKIELVRFLLREDRRITYQQLKKNVGIGSAAINTIINDHLKY
ncbi:hypothetical protein LAZ67_X001512 [Cordylochernes scorpioides]|uniref:Transposase n=1 Tax=Cordylochernes scorpioides TaxID=51811 RepID=A0ABY6LSY6_9ARAC|nr:hypothetical protein LAZ67_X001512 [Cordylochernes scorpioides]